ncbi:hypothetical protein [Streptomyces sp. NPDC005262]|uniref:hypothetical protein n=1 Tax=Streptomyces sp. NPDC005262 TaxID=3364710 RepID=UPI003693847A
MSQAAIGKIVDKSSVISAATLDTVRGCSATAITDEDIAVLVSWTWQVSRDPHTGSSKLVLQLPTASLD